MAQAIGAFARDSPQHRVDQAGVTRRVAVALYDADGEVDRGMIEHVEKKDLRGADQQGRVDLRCLRRCATFEEETDEMTQGAETSQHRRDQRPRQRAVAIGKPGKSGVSGGAVELFVERTVSA